MLNSNTLLLISLGCLLVALVCAILSARWNKEAKRERGEAYADYLKAKREKHKHSYCMNCKHGLTTYRETIYGQVLDSVGCDLEKVCENFERASAAD